jgi:hypothetical protein
MFVFSDNRLMQDVSYTKQEVENFKRKVDHKQMFSGNVDSTINVSNRSRLSRKTGQKTPAGKGSSAATAPRTW